MQVTAHNRGPDAATLHLLPTLWFRNTWSWGYPATKPGAERPSTARRGSTRRARRTPSSATGCCSADASAQLLFCENETNNERLFGAPNASPYVKDAINEFVVDGAVDAVNPEQTGTKVAAHHALEIAGGDSATIRVRLTRRCGADGGERAKPLGCRLRTRSRPRAARRPTSSTRRSSRTTLRADGAQWSCARRSPGCCGASSTTSTTCTAGCVSTGSTRGIRTPRPAQRSRNVPWFHMVAGDVISMPDKWEYPWFAAWDLAFHTAPLSLVDVDFAKEQVELLLDTRYLHPNGQIPAYEWNFSDVNPPVTAWAALFVYEREARDPRRRRPRVPRARVRPAADQLHLVGQPQGPRRPQPLPGRVPRPRQHRDLRPLGAAARRRHARAGRRHRVDGAVLPVDAADRGRADQARPGLRGHGAEVRRPTSSGSRSP